MLSSQYCLINRNLPRKTVRQIQNAINRSQSTTVTFSDAPHTNHADKRGAPQSQPNSLSTFLPHATPTNAGRWGRPATADRVRGWFKRTLTESADAATDDTLKTPTTPLDQAQRARYHHIALLGLVN